MRCLRLTFLLLGGGLLPAQYALRGTYSQPNGSPVQVELRLTPAHMRYRLTSEQQGQMIAIELFITQEKAYWIGNQKAYEIQIEKPFPQPLVKATFLEQIQEGVSKWELEFADRKRMIIVWDSTYAFDWKVWDSWLEMYQFGSVIRRFQKGLPREVVEYQEDVMISQFRVDAVEPYRPASEGVPYPVTKEPFIRPKEGR